MTIKKIDPNIFNNTSSIHQRNLLLSKLNEAIDIIKNIQAVTNQNTADIAKIETRIDSDIDWEIKKQTKDWKESIAKSKVVRCMYIQKAV